MTVCPHDQSVPLKKRTSKRRRCARCGIVLSLRHPRRASKAASMLGNAGSKRKLFAILTARDGPDCHWCGTELTRPGPIGPHLPTDRTLDHVIPWSLGGSNEPENLVLACQECNGKRGATGAPP